MAVQDLEDLIPFATARQAELARAWLQHGSAGRAARALGMSCKTVESSIRRLRNRAARKDPSKHVARAPEGYHLRGVSTLVNTQTGQPVMQWQKTARDGFDPEKFAEACAGAIETIPRARITRSPRRVQDDLLHVLPIGDPHFGMLSWAPETGEDWDLAIAARTHARAISQLLSSAPCAQRTLVVWMGDSAHADDTSGLTPASKHVLDVDSRWEKMIGILFTAMVNSIGCALRRSREVVCRVVKGNHDPHVAAALALALEAHYRTEPRVLIERAPTPLYVTTWGRVLLAFAHGHAPTPDRVPDVLAADYRTEIGATEQGYLFTGHRHNKMLTERGGLVMEAVQTLAARDAYATHGGYRSARGLSCITFDRRKLAPIQRIEIAAQDLG